MEKLFRYFLAKNFQDAFNQMKVSDMDSLGEEFHRYLELKLSPEQKERILPKNGMEVIMNADNPLKRYGFHPAYVLHFTEWIQIMQEKSTDEIPQI